MRNLAAATAIVCLFVQPGSAQERRELGAHQHGHGTLSIAIEGTTVRMELEVPGNDIVGFEHTAKTKAQRAAVEKGKAQLSAPLDLFTFPPGAGCKVTQADVTIGSERHEEEKPGAQGKHAGHDHDHSEFRAAYTLECIAVNHLTSVEFPYFGLFKAADGLAINIVTPKGQSRFEVTRAKPRVDLSGMM